MRGIWAALGLALGLLGMGSIAALAEPITLLDLNLGMSPEENRAKLESEGFVCEPLSDVMGPGFFCEAGSGEARTVLAAEGVLAFGCGLFDACSSPPAELAQTLVEQGVVATLAPNENDQYCGRGLEGEEICVGYLLSDVRLLIVRVSSSEQAQLAQQEIYWERLPGESPVNRNGGPSKMTEALARDRAVLAIADHLSNIAPPSDSPSWPEQSKRRAADGRSGLAFNLQ